MLIKYNSTRKRFEAGFSFDEFKTAHPLVKEAGFAFDGNAKPKTWHSAGYKNDRTFPEQIKIAAKLFDYCDEDARKMLGLTTPEARAQQINPNAKIADIAASRATDSDIEIPCPTGINPKTGKPFAYLPYQKAGIAYAMKRVNVLIGDDMGLGKTIQAIGLSNTDKNIRSVLIVCPNSPKINWSREWQAWDVKGLSVGIARQDSVPDTDVVIINYDIVRRNHSKIVSRTWDMMVLDESHKAKNPKAQRTEAIYGAEAKKKKDKATKKMVSVPAIPGITARRFVYLTGTPILNRPVEMWTMIQKCDPDGLGRNFFKFALRYCNATQTAHGWDFLGSSNLDELQEKLRSTFMVRRLKEDVLKDLPKKIRQVILLEPDARGRKLIEKEKIEYAKLEMKSGDTPSLAQMSEVRKEVALYKVPFVLEHVDDLLETHNKVIVFAHHKEVVDKIMEHYGAAAVKVDGRVTSVEARQAAVDRFQTDPTCTIFVGSILAAGVALTLTAASMVVFAELDWVPANVTQAEDRAHRIGQLFQVLVHHILLDGSLDARFVDKIIEKQAIADAALDTVKEIKPVEMPAVGEAKQEVKPTTIRTKQGVETVNLTPDQIAAIHSGLKMLRGTCDGAMQRDGMGFNGLDVQFGWSLADAAQLSMRQAGYGQKLVRKYQGQLPQELVIAAGITPKGSR